MDDAYFDAKAGIWKNGSGKPLPKAKKRYTQEEILDLYLAYYDRAVKAGSPNEPNFETWNAAKLLKDGLHNTISLTSLRNIVAKHRRDMNRLYGKGKGPYKGRGGIKIWVPTLRTQAQISRGSDDAKKAMYDRLRKKYDF